MANKPSIIPATEFKSHCLRILDDVSAGKSVTVTKRGKPIARVVPIERPASGKTLGRWKGSVEIVGDIVHNDWAGEFEATKRR